MGYQMNWPREKISNAYLVFYERADDGYVPISEAEEERQIQEREIQKQKG